MRHKIHGISNIEFKRNQILLAEMRIVPGSICQNI